MEEGNAGNSEETVHKVIGRPFPKGVSGNPSGRPKGTLKDFIRQKFMKMTEEEKDEWLKEHKIAGIDQWKMGEGNPDNSLEATGTLKVLLIDKELAGLYGIRITSETDDSGQEPKQVQGS